MLLNIPLVAIGTQGYPVLSLFLVGNLITCCAIIPLVAGLIPALRNLLTETGFCIGFVGGILGVTASGIGINWIPGDAATSFSAGANWAWYGNNYDWRVFLAALLCSLGSMMVWSVAAWGLERVVGASGPGISGLLMKVPGMKWLTAEPNWTGAECKSLDLESGSSRSSSKDADVFLGDVDNKLAAKGAPPATSRGDTAKTSDQS